MKNILKFLRGKTAKIAIQDNVVTVERENGEIAVFEANKENYLIEYNIGMLGGELTQDEHGILTVADMKPTNFVSGETYGIDHVEFSTDTKGKTKISYEDTFCELFLCLETGDDTFADILLQSDDIKVSVNGELQPKKERRIFAGYYKRYDGMPFYVVDVVQDLETGQEVVICRNNLERKNYFTLTKEAFCAKIDYNGKMIKKYFRATRREKIGHWESEELVDDGYRPPIRHENKEDRTRFRRHSKTYREYAKDLCDWYKIDLRCYQLCQKTKRLVGVMDKKDLFILKEDLRFLHNCLKTTLKDYAEYFKERFIDGKSIRKYGEEHGLNRGSVDYIQKKMITELAKNLEDRDKADGKSRLKK